jgi:hypothetical protein
MQISTELVYRRRRQFLTLLASSLAASGLSACGGGSDSAPATATPVTTTPAAAPVAVPVADAVTTPVTTPVTEPVTEPATAPVAEPVTEPATPVATPVTKSVKRGIAYDLAAAPDLAALSPGVSWWYNWGTQPNSTVPSDYRALYGMDYLPMLWNSNFDATAMVAYLKANPSIQYLLLLNEPNLVDQANMTPSQAAALWPRYEALAAATAVKLVGPAITWGTMTGYSDPVLWLDAFYASFQSANGRDPQIDYLAFHWYDYGLGDQLDRLAKYAKPIWVTEMANWHSQADGAQITTAAQQKTQMTEMVALCEGRADVFRYAWFIGRMNPDPHFTSLLGDSGVLTALGQHYLSLPYTTAAT